MRSELDRRAACPGSKGRPALVFVAWLGLATLIAACSSSSGGADAHVVADAGDAPADRAGNDGPADAGVDTAPVDAAASDGPAADADAATDSATSDVAVDGGPATPIAVQVPASSAPTVAGWRRICVVSDTDGTNSNTCWVIQWRQWTYWALSNVDNREAFLIIGADAAGNLKSAGVERMGTRYVWQATVDATAMTVSYFGQGGVVTLSWVDLDEEPPPAPEASEAAVELAPTVAGWKATCIAGASDATLTNTCPVVKWGQWTYWALSSANNDAVLYIVGVDANGVVNPAGGVSKNGTRYLWKVTVDGTARTATFYGQGGINVDATFDELRIDQP
jgi:hypothetical protein